MDSITLLIPCLNEERTLGLVLEKCLTVKHRLESQFGRSVEILVSDNGSTDRSVDIATQHNARVAHCPTKGYGAALLHGITEAKGSVVVFADADNTYDFLEAPKLIQALDESHVDMVIGSRISGDIKPGAMPWLHHFLGTPILTYIINLLYTSDNNRFLDCNSGFRCFRKSAFLKWGVTSTGMEFASEMLVKAAKARATIGHAPITLYPSPAGRIPHLRTWRDGMRHLLQIVLEAPFLFARLGGAIFIAAWLTMLLSLLGPFLIPNPLANFWYWLEPSFSLFGLHTQLFGLGLSVIGLTIWSIGLFLSARSSEAVGLYARICNLSEDTLFWRSVGLLFALSVITMASVGLMVVRWRSMHYTFLDLERPTVVVVAALTNGVLLVSHCLTAHLLKRRH